MAGNSELLDESKTAMVKCSRLLRELSSSCCMPERSSNMNEAFTKLDCILHELEMLSSTENSINKSIKYIGDFGSIIGYLYATCCTDTRKTLYQQMYDELGVAHGKLWQYSGHSH